MTQIFKGQFLTYVFKISDTKHYIKGEILGCVTHGTFVTCNETN